MIRILILLAVVAGGVIGYRVLTDPLTAENLDRIEVGMSGAEVVEILGEPDEIERVEGLGALSAFAERRIWRSGDREAVISFGADKVMLPPERKGF